MGFTEAIQSGFQNYVNFEGRASRPAYWWWALFVFIVSLVTNIIDNALGWVPMTAYGTVGVGVLSGLVSLALLLPGLGLFVRRMHDTDRSGLWFFLAFIPIIGAIILIVFLASPGTPGPNRYGAAPDTGTAYAAAPLA